MSDPSISRNRRARSRSRDDQRRRMEPKARVPWTNWLLLGLVWAATLVLIHSSRRVLHNQYTLNQQAPSTVIAEIDFDVEDFDQTDLKRDQEEEAVSQVFSINPTGLHRASRDINKLFDHLVIYHRNPSAAATEIPKMATLLDAFGIELPATKFVTFAASNHVTNVRNVILTSVEQTWNNGIAEPAKLGDAERITLIGSTKSEERIVASMHTPHEAVSVTVERAQTLLKSIEPKPEVLRALVKPWMVHNLNFEKTRTEESRTAAREQVQPQMVPVRVGDSIMEAGERITPQIIEKLKVHEQRLRNEESLRDQIYEIAGHAFLLLAALFVCCVVLHKINPQHLHNRSMILLQGLLGLIAVLGTRGLLHLSLSQNLIPSEFITPLLPLAFAPLVAAILVNGAFTLSVGIWSSFAISMMISEPFPILTLGLVLTVIASVTASEIHRRTTLFRAGLWIGIAHAIFTVSLGVMNHQTPDHLISQAGAAILGGVAFASIALLTIPVFEWMFKITTDIRLLELSDMSHPLLERLALEAPGTYNHSLMVANLAASAATEVGANSLLVRVCGYYHDIGKLTKPEFFIENSHQAENPHDDITPSMSTLVIVSHVKEGLSMAANYNLPSPIREAIRTHHGTSIISFFYHRAKRLAAANEEIAPDPSDFRYPGPKPTSIEMGILLLADTVEAASRSMEKPTPGNIENLVNNLVNDKMTDGQLDDCNITFAQLATIKKSFIFNLNNMLHRRIPYPKHEDRTKQPPKPAEDRPSETGSTQQLATATRSGT